jgi:hypothetical protein
MSDWADQELDKIPVFNKTMRPRVAAALRKAKATGIRGAAEWCVAERMLTREQADRLWAQADRIEKGEQP